MNRGAKVVMVTKVVAKVAAIQTPMHTFQYQLLQTRNITRDAAIQFETVTGTVQMTSVERSYVGITTNMVSADGVINAVSFILGSLNQIRSHQK